jgi:hypothetical protein
MNCCPFVEAISIVLFDGNVKSRNPERLFSAYINYSALLIALVKVFLFFTVFEFFCLVSVVIFFKILRYRAFSSLFIFASLAGAEPDCKGNYRKFHQPN